MLVLIPLLIAVFLALTWARAFYGSMRDYGTGEEMLKKKEVIRAVTFFDRSIHWYTPLNPYVEKSAQRLWEIGEEAEKQGDLTMALIAFRTIRGGFYAASHFTTPGKDWIERSEQRIAQLVVKQEKGEAGDTGAERSKGKATQVQKSPEPDVFWTVVLEVGFLGWVGSLLGFIYVTWGPKTGSGKPRYKSLFLIGLASGCFVIWIVGMMKA